MAVETGAELRLVRDLPNNGPFSGNNYYFKAKTEGNCRKGEATNTLFTLGGNNVLLVFCHLRNIT